MTVKDTFVDSSNIYTVTFQDKNEGFHLITNMTLTLGFRLLSSLSKFTNNFESR